MSDLSPLLCEEKRTLQRPTFRDVGNMPGNCYPKSTFSVMGSSEADSKGPTPALLRFELFSKADQGTSASPSHL